MSCFPIYFAKIKNGFGNEITKNYLENSCILFQLWGTKVAENV